MLEGLRVILIGVITTLIIIAVPLGIGSILFRIDEEVWPEDWEDYKVAYLGGWFGIISLTAAIAVFYVVGAFVTEII